MPTPSPLISAILLGLRKRKGNGKGSDTTPTSSKPSPTDRRLVEIAKEFRAADSDEAAARALRSFYRVMRSTDGENSDSG